MNQEVNYLASWEEYCEANGLDYEENVYLEPYWQATQEKLFGFISKLLI